MSALKILKTCLPDLVTIANKILDLVIKDKEENEKKETEKSESPS